MNKKDFSIRHEVEVTAKELLGAELTEQQIDQIVGEIEQYDTFLDIVTLFVVKGIQEVAKEENIPLDEEEAENQLMISRNNINLNDI